MGDGTVLSPSFTVYTVSKSHNNINRQVQTSGDAHSGTISLRDVT